MQIQVPQVDYAHALATLRVERLRRSVGKPVPAPKAPNKWPPDYVQVLAWRHMQLARFELDPTMVDNAKAYYKDRPVEFINHWCDTYDPRRALTGESATIPLIMFAKQQELVDFIVACIEGQAPGLIEKSRDMGATWVCCAISVWLWLLHPGAAIGWGSATQDKVDKIGKPGSIFEKLRMLIRGLPEQFKPQGFEPSSHLLQQRIINPETGSSITGEIGDNIGRGDRTLIYFVDESAHLAHPEAVEAALQATTNTRIDMSSVSGLGTIFHRKREAGVDWVPGAKALQGTTNVLVMDWRDHPTKDEAWHKRESTRLEDYGLGHVFAREVERNYAAAVEGIIIPAEHVRSAIDAHLKLGFDDAGGWVAGLDVADSGGDRNAYVKRKGVILKAAQEWGAPDVGVTARRAVQYSADTLPISLQYDSIGIGAGVKAETNRLKNEGMLPEGMVITPWNAGSAVLNPFGNVIEGERDSPRNRDFFANLKAQGWWMLRLRFERTHRAITEGITFNPDDMISIDSTIPLLRQLEKELSQATISYSTGAMKMIVNKTPEGTKSPNLADATVECFWPVTAGRLPRTSISGPIVVSAHDND